MHMHNAWGGSFDVAMDSATDDDRSRNLDMDRAALQRLEETQQSWLLGPTEKKKKRYVDLGCMVCSRKLFIWVVGSIVGAIVLTGFITLLVETVPRHHSHPPPEDSYTQALHKALLFFNAQKSGRLPKHNNISWRGNSALKDGSLQSVDLVGGYYDAGDNIKFGFPGAFTITVLSWSVIEYSAKYEAIGELDHVKELIKWGTDYLLKTFNSSAPSIDIVWGQVGTGGTPGDTTPNDHYCWERPEDMDYERQAYSCGACSDLAAEMAAALAAASIVFKDNRAYSLKLVQGATVLFAFARERRGRYVKAIPDAETYYNSTGYWDEYIWGSAWMYFATGNSSYLKLATAEGLAKHAGASGGWKYYGIFDWDNKLTGAQVVLTRFFKMMSPGYPYENVLQQFKNETELIMCSYLPQYKVFNQTKGGMMEFNYGNPQPLQYVAGSAFLAALYADYLSATSAPVWPCGPDFLSRKVLRDFARSQIDYILGNNPAKMSYVVGYGKRYPIRVHHRGASIPRGRTSQGCTTGYKYRDSRLPNPHVLVGAMVAGPDTRDRFADNRYNYNYTEPTIAGNACLVAALVALSGGDDKGVDTNTIFSAVPAFFPNSPPPPGPWRP
ncbi:hypothetical protein KP509_11G098200 [Ceratopteris richardii]|uniref:Endoglucanase n=2 Tax=Ceratopteris richardii TaxID=49495 RepID=A0A8T2TSH7_CERRI|nr:hypothetical protein KP509_11G098200 [Ceratopteris richardii]